MMTVDEKIGQLFFVGFEGYKLNIKTKKFLEKIQPGGVIFFECNIKEKNQVKDLISEINECIKIKPFIGIDQEGGSVERLRNISTSVPSVWGLSKLGLSELLKIQEIIALDLCELGFNLNFSPVLDINTNPSNPVIGTRSINSNKNLVSKYGCEIINVFLKNGIIPVGKHFPGHGDLAVDSHFFTPVLLKTKRELYEEELTPFIRAIKNNVPALMISHISLPKIEPEKLKVASISENIIDKLLRTELGFKGLVITDDMVMQGITRKIANKKACKEAILAGANLLLYNWETEKSEEAYESLKKETQNNKKLKEKIEESVEKILFCKEKYLKSKNKENKKINKEKTTHEITSNVVHFIKKDILFSPIEENKPLEIIYPISPKLRKEDLVNIVKKLGLKKVDFLNYSLNPTYKEIKEINKCSIKYDKKVLITYDISFRKRQKTLADLLLKADPNLIIISVGLENDMEFLPKVNNFISAYAPNYISLYCAFEKVVGFTQMIKKTQ